MKDKEAGFIDCGANIGMYTLTVAKMGRKVCGVNIGMYTLTLAKIGKKGWKRNLDILQFLSHLQFQAN